LTCGDTRVAVALEVVIIDWDEQQVERVDVEGVTTECERNDRTVDARNDVIPLSVSLRAGDLGVDGLGVSVGSDDEGGASVEDGGAAIQSEALSVDGHGETALPETVPIDVLEGDKGASVVLGLVKTSKRNLTVVETVGKSGNLVRRDGLADQPFLGENLTGVGMPWLEMVDLASPKSPSEVGSLVKSVDSTRAVPKVR